MALSKELDVNTITALLSDCKTKTKQNVDFIDFIEFKQFLYLIVSHLGLSTKRLIVILLIHLDIVHIKFFVIYASILPLM